MVHSRFQDFFLSYRGSMYLFPDPYEINLIQKLDININLGFWSLNCEIPNKTNPPMFIEHLRLVKHWVRTQKREKDSVFSLKRSIPGAHFGSTYSKEANLCTPAPQSQQSNVINQKSYLRSKDLSLSSMLIRYMAFLLNLNFLLCNWGVTVILSDSEKYCTEIQREMCCENCKV